MERSVVAYSTRNSMQESFQEVCKKIDASKDESITAPILIIYFSTEEYFWYYTQEFKKKYPSSTCIGACSCRNVSSESFEDVGLSAMAVYYGIECAPGVLFDVDIHPSLYVNHVKTAVKSILESDSQSWKKNNLEESAVCLEFTTCNCDGEGLVLDTLHAGFGERHITVAGSSTGYFSNGERSFVALNGEMYKKSCVFVLIHNLQGKIHTYVENIYKPTGFTFTVTDLDCENHKVYEFDEKPAVERICEAVGVKEKDLPELFKTHPMGIITGDRENTIINLDVKDVFDDGSISFYSGIYNHTKVVLMELDDVDNVFLDTELKVNSAIPNPSFGIIMNCISRSSYFETAGLIDKCKKVLAQTCKKYVGITGYGEQMNLNTYNASLVLVVFE